MWATYTNVAHMWTMTLTRAAVTIAWCCALYVHSMLPTLGTRPASVENFFGQLARVVMGNFS